MARDEQRKPGLRERRKEAKRAKAERIPGLLSKPCSMLLCKLAPNDGLGHDT